MTVLSAMEGLDNADRQAAGLDLMHVQYRFAGRWATACGAELWSRLRRKNSAPATLRTAGTPMIMIPALAAVRESRIEVSLFYGRPTGALSGFDAAGLTREIAKHGIGFRPIHQPRLNAKIWLGTTTICGHKSGPAFSGPFRRRPPERDRSVRGIESRRRLSYSAVRTRQKWLTGLARLTRVYT